MPRIRILLVPAMIVSGLLIACSTPLEASRTGTSSVEEPPPATRASLPAPPSGSPAATDPSPSDHARDVRLPAYRASVEPIGSRGQMRYSHRAGCPLRPAELRLLRISFVGFDAQAHMGEMVVHEDQARDVIEVFRELYEARWPIRRMQLVDDYQGEDDRSMAANNTSGYNCRRVAGSDRWSAHAFGAAIDINPVQNPYVTTGSIAPPAGRPFATIDRSPGVTVPIGAIREDDLVVRAFAGIGWEWGGNWSNSKDYQHFSATGR